MLLVAASMNDTSTQASEETPSFSNRAVKIINGSSQQWARAPHAFCGRDLRKNLAGKKRKAWEEIKQSVLER